MGPLDSDWRKARRVLHLHAAKNRSWEAKWRCLSGRVAVLCPFPDKGAVTPVKQVGLREEFQTEGRTDIKYSLSSATSLWVSGLLLF